MKLNTKYFGVIEYEAEDVLHFPNGLFGFEKEHDFLLLPFAGSEGSLLFFQSVETNQLAFIAMIPFSLDHAYAPLLSEAE